MRPHRYSRCCHPMHFTPMVQVFEVLGCTLETSRDHGYVSKNSNECELIETQWHKPPIRDGLYHPFLASHWRWLMMFMCLASLYHNWYPINCANVQRCDLAKQQILQLFMDHVRIGYGSSLILRQPYHYYGESGPLKTMMLDMGGMGHSPSCRTLQKQMD